MRILKSKQSEQMTAGISCGCDETEIVIRVLSFGPYVKALEPESFVNLIKERLISQKSCELK